MLRETAQGGHENASEVQAVQLPNAAEESQRTTLHFVSAGEGSERSESPHRPSEGQHSHKFSVQSFRPLPDKADFRIREDWSRQVAIATIHEHPRDMPTNTSRLRYMDGESEEELDCLSARLAPLMMTPQSRGRIAWDVLSAIFIACDAVLIPLQLLLDEGEGWAIINWILRVFWTSDLGMNFLRGFARPDGSVEMSPRRASVQYLKTWFALDFSIVCLDWLDLVDLESTDAARLGKSVKMIRFLKVARLIRLVRFSRMTELIGHLAAFFRSGMFPTIMGIFKIMTGMMIFWHLLACVWYRLGIDSETDANWIDRFGYSAKPIGHLYFISLHWALTLFIGTMEVTPVNYDERVLTVIALYFSFFLSAAVISSITSSMTKLDLLTVQRDSKLTALKQYLFDNNISPRLTLRIQRSVVMAIQEQERDVPEHKVELLNLAAESLKSDLHFERYMPLLAQHPLFGFLQFLAEDVMRRFCHTAISRISIAPSEVIISNDTNLEQTDMFFLESGTASYVSSYQGHITISSTSRFPWLCEPALWTHWTNIGACLAKTHCSLLRIDGLQFRQVAKTAAHPDFLPVIRTYSEKFIATLNEQEPEDLTDLHDYSDFDLETVLSSTREDTQTEMANSRRAAKVFLQKSKRKSWLGRVTDSRSGPRKS